MCYCNVYHLSITSEKRSKDTLTTLQNINESKSAISLHFWAFFRISFGSPVRKKHVGSVAPRKKKHLSQCREWHDCKADFFFFFFALSKLVLGAGRFSHYCYPTGHEQILRKKSHFYSKWTNSLISIAMWIKHRHVACSQLVLVK